jgi:CelD/BcsL family acetyltransferase involved in cellulose biosynthesis
VTQAPYWARYPASIRSGAHAPDAARAARDRRSASSGSASTWLTAAATAVGSPGGMSTAAAGGTTSATPSTAVATTGAPNLRATIRKATRRLEQEGVAHRVVQGAAVHAALDHLRRLHGARWGERSRFLAAYERFAAASRAGAARGEVAFHELVAGGQVVATVSCLEVAGRVSLYQSGRLSEHRWRNAATVLLVKVVEDACRRGLAEVDLLRGDEPYKRNFASAARELLRLQAAHGAAGRLALVAVALEARMRWLAGRPLRRVRARLRRPRPFSAPAARA